METYTTADYMISKLALTSEEFGSIKCSPIPADDPDTPPLYTKGDNDVLSLQASGPFGSFLFHELRNENYSIRQNLFNLQMGMKLSFDIGTWSLATHYVLKNRMRFIIDGFPEGLILRHQYNAVFVPEVKWQYIFDKPENYACFGIHFTTNYLQRCQEIFPLLPEFAKNIRQSTPALASETHITATHQMLDIIRYILQCNFTGTIKRMYLESKVPELLLLSFQNMHSGEVAARVVSIKHNDLKKIEDARDYLRKNAENPPTLRELAQLTGLNEFKLKNGIKQAYGTTIYGIVLEERMKHAEVLLRETDKPVLDIALETGYKNLSNFTAAFKRKFGLPPSSVRHGKIFRE